MPKRTLDRFLSRAGVASRTGAAALIRDGRVRVNGRAVFEPDTWIDPDQDTVTLNGEAVDTGPPRRVVVYNKPRGVLSTLRDPDGRPTVADDLPSPYRDDASLRPIGRLDQASAGLLLWTSDNDLGSRLLEKARGIAKVYRVKLRPPPTPADLDRWRDGIDIGDPEPARASAVTVERTSAKSTVVRATLIEGRNRQIRRMAGAIDADVEWLVRVAFGPVLLGELAPGDAREATAGELAALLDATGMTPDWGG